jgi:cellulose synthase/poly-beta-1,6-N-acetylglucosamine synthase-like glycosyltransferase
MVISYSIQTFDPRQFSEAIFSPNARFQVIRACNEEKHIARLLEGIAQQFLKEAEIILVDSGSTDRTLEIASQ